MTPKEKAEVLVLKFMRLQEPNYNWFHKGLAKQCAMIAVDEVIQTLSLDGRLIFMYIIDWWKDVKNEIDRL